MTTSLARRRAPLASRPPQRCAGGAFKQLRVLLKHKLVHHENARYDGYRLTPLGYDFLALHALTSRGALTAVGRKVGVGKESDVYEARNGRGTGGGCGGAEPPPCMPPLALASSTSHAPPRPTPPRR